MEMDREKDKLLLPMIVGQRYGTLESPPRGHDSGDAAIVSVTVQASRQVMLTLQFPSSVFLNMIISGQRSRKWRQKSSNAVAVYKIGCALWPAAFSISSVYVALVHDSWILYLWRLGYGKNIREL